MRYGGSLVHLIRRKINGRLPRQLLSGTDSKFWNHTSRRINKIMLERDYRYLEIGVALGTTLQAVESKHKVGVDPFPLFDTTALPSNVDFFHCDSDKYFSEFRTDKKFDFIFLDGLHEINQLWRDFVNSLRNLETNGWVLIDDIIPNDSISAIPDINESYRVRGVSAEDGYPWHGDCFRILPHILKLDFLEPYIFIYPDNPQLLIRVVNWTRCNQFIYGSNVFDRMFEDDYQSVFNSDSLKHMPIYLEEILINEIQFGLGENARGL